MPLIEHASILLSSIRLLPSKAGYGDHYDYAPGEIDPACHRKMAISLPA